MLAVNHCQQANKHQSTNQPLPTMAYHVSHSKVKLSPWFTLINHQLTSINHYSNSNSLASTHRFTKSSPGTPHGFTVHQLISHITNHFTNHLPSIHHLKSLSSPTCSTSQEQPQLPCSQRQEGRRRPHRGGQRHHGPAPRGERSGAPGAAELVTAQRSGGLERRRSLRLHMSLGCGEDAVRMEDVDDVVND